MYSEQTLDISYHVFTTVSVPIVVFFVVTLAVFYINIKDLENMMPSSYRVKVSGVRQWPGYVGKGTWTEKSLPPDTKLQW
jgi:hypothetical protein